VLEGTVLVTGGAGFIGANLVRRLVRDGLDVHITCHHDEPSWRLTDVAPLETHRCSVTDAAAVSTLVGDVRPRWVFHLAAHGAYAHQTDTARIVAVNTLGTFNLLDALDQHGGCAGFVHTGSSSEYGLKDHAAAEGELVEPDSVYAITKCAATHAVSFRARRGLPAATVRLYSVYGPWEEPSRLVPRLVVAARTGTLPPLVAPATARDFVWIDDAVEGIVRAARNAAHFPGAIWNLGSGVQTSLEQLVSVARDVFGVLEEPRWGSMENRAWDTARWVGDPRRARDELGWEAGTGLADGLRATAAWLATSRERARYEE
jgi:nucleoside-diphosphate-sugar epimerase